MTATDGVLYNMQEVIRAQAEGREPQPINLVDDRHEPIIIVSDGASSVPYMQGALRINERLAAGEITKWYRKNAVLELPEDRVDELLPQFAEWPHLKYITRTHPIVMTYQHEGLRKTLERMCCQGVYVIPTDARPTASGAVGCMSQDEWAKKLTNAIKIVKVEDVLAVPDMREACLDGWLGDLVRTRLSRFPLGFAWVAGLTAASVLVQSSARCNLYGELVGGVGCGKTQTIKALLYLLGLDKPTVLDVEGAGSSEGFMQHHGDQGGRRRLWHQDEMGHLFDKCAIEGSTLPRMLNSAFYSDNFTVTMARGRQARFNMRMSILGGIVDEEFSDAHGRNTITGFYDREIFALCPTGFKYKHREMTGGAAITPTAAADDDAFAVSWAPSRPVPVEVDESVYEWADKLRDELPEDARRVVELGIRAAIVAAAFDGRPVLRAEHLGSARAFIDYQLQMRELLKPSTGRNDAAILGEKLMRHVKKYSAKEPDKPTQWLNLRKVLQNTHAYEFGPPIIDRVLTSLENAGLIEMDERANGANPQKLVRWVRE